MATGSKSFRHFVLGLLAHSPMSGYDIRRLMQSLGWLMGNPSFGSIYPALHALLEDGLATVEVVPYQSKPPRKIYSITEAGRRALQEWLDRPAVENAPLRAFVMRLILAEQFTPTGLVAHLEQRRDQVAAQYAALEQMIEGLSEQEDVGRWLAVDYALSVAAAELAWLDRRLERSMAEPVRDGGPG